MANAHPSDEQLIGHMYGVHVLDEHLGGCASCRSRIQAMQAHRAAMDRLAAVEEDVSPQFLAAQRRAIYERMAKPKRGLGFLPRWAPVAAMLVLFSGGGIVVLERNHTPARSQPAISDAELAMQVSQIASDPEPAAAAPIEALFED